jgi:membrane peptidoglycan carboxypeptidase
MRSTSVAVGRVLGLLSLFLVVSVVAGALVAGLLVPAVAAAGGATRGSIDWFNGITTNLPDTRLQQTSQLLAADGTLIARFSDENRTEAPLSKISKNMQNAIIAIEDARFRDHGGVDPVGLLRAFASNEFGNGTEVQGASTLTQQYIKNLFLEQAVAKGDKQAQAQAVARDPKRKLLEIRAAIDLEKVLTKDQILERYLNIAYFGNGAYGVQAAAERYFSVSAAKLTVPQAALLAGMVQSPTLYNPLSNATRRKAALDRRNTVLDRMHELGLMSARRWQSFRAGKLGLKPKAQQTGCIVASHSLAYFCEYVRTMIANGSGPFKALGATQKERVNTLNRGGLKIYTTIDLKVQDAAVAAVTKRVPIGDKSKAASAAVTVEPGTGRVLAMTQNKKYATKANDPSSTTINYSVDTQYNGSSGMQTGSTFKAFTLAAYLKDGNGLRDTVDASVESRPFSEFRSCGSTRAKGGTYTFHNSESGEKGRISVLDATAGSVNTAYVAMETKVPLCDIAKTADSIGVHLAAPANPCGGQPSTEVPDCLPSLTLGPLSISPLTMAEAYASFAADGTFCPAWPLEKILNPDGKEIPLNKPACDDKALPADVAHGVTYALKQVLTRGTAAGVWSGGTRNIAGKTGTTDASKDTWFVGYTKQRATAVWVGDSVETFQHRRKNGKIAQRQSLNGRKIGGRQYGHIFGATIAAPIWADIMRTAIKGTDLGDWENPPSSMLAGHGVPVPDVRGRSIGEATGILSGAGFQVRLGRPMDSDQPIGTVASTSPSGGDLTNPGDTVIIYPSTGRGGATNAADQQTKPKPGRGRGGGRGRHHGGPPTRT